MRISEGGGCHGCYFILDSKFLGIQNKSDFRLFFYPVFTLREGPVCPPPRSQGALGGVLPLVYLLKGGPVYPNLPRSPLVMFYPLYSV